VSEAKCPGIALQLERLATMNLRTIEAEVAAQRVAWLEETVPRQARGRSVSPRRAYELLFQDYMGLVLSELPVTHETDSEIAWLSKNPCPTLEACQELSLDTRTVCRGAYEKSTQAFLSWLDPRLRFIRDYKVIRPYAAHCQERIIRLDFDRFMEIAIEEAMFSKKEGNKGYGAVVTMGDRVISRTHDSAVTEGDPSLHAEFKAIREAAAALDRADLCGAVLFSTCEPCPMCMGLAVWANLTSIVYGASIADTAHMGKSRILVDAKEIAARSPNLLEVIGGVLKESCESLYRQDP
jgi:tRNA(Arg) A34 adenosine deaminase TadA